MSMVLYVGNGLLGSNGAYFQCLALAYRLSISIAPTGALGMSFFSSLDWCSLGQSSNLGHMVGLGCAFKLTELILLFLYIGYLKSSSSD
jgi:hypothetical protein